MNRRNVLGWMLGAGATAAACKVMPATADELKQLDGAPHGFLGIESHGISLIAAHGRMYDAALAAGHANGEMSLHFSGEWQALCRMRQQAMALVKGGSEPFQLSYDLHHVGGTPKKSKSVAIVFNVED